MGLCGEDNKAARELAAKSLKTFFGPDRPYLKDQTNVYEQLMESWGGVPDHLQNNFARYLKTEGDPRARRRWTSPAARDRSPRRCGTRSTPTRWSIAASSSPAIPRAASRASPSTRRPASTSCSS